MNAFPLRPCCDTAYDSDHLADCPVLAVGERLAFPMPCGRLDHHDEHEWTRPRTLDDLGCTLPARTYNCAGRVLVEGGWWLDWNADEAAEDDAREDQQREDRIEDELLRRALSTWGDGKIA